MSQIASQLAQGHAAAATAQANLRNGLRVIRRDMAPSIVQTTHEAEIVDDEDETVIVVATPAELPIVVPLTASPLDLPAEQFRSGLDRRKQNRQLLMDWIRASLVEGVDFGKVHIASKERCDHAKQGRARECTNPYHWSKPSLFKPGAEKITGMLGMTVHYPSLPALEQAVLAGAQISQVMLRCELRDAQGHVVAEGVGARSLAQDYGDINKSLKMTEKSAHIDATLRMAGLSEVFTQDLEDSAGASGSDDLPANPPTTRKPADKPSKTSHNASDAGFSGSATNRAAKPPLPLPPPHPPADTEIITADDVEIVRNRIVEVGITEKRVLAWLNKVTKGTVMRFDQLNVAQCTSLLKRLGVWAQEIADQPSHQGEQ